MRDRTTDRPIRALRALPIVAGCGWAVLILLSSGCHKKTPPSPPSAAGSASASASVVVPVEPIGIKSIDALPVTMRVAQRSTTAVPGTADQLSIAVDDITRGQVKITVLEKDRKPIAGPVSVKQDQAVSFRLGETAYAARVVELSNALIGDDDFVTIVIDQLGGLELPGSSDRSSIDSTALKLTPPGKNFAAQSPIEPPRTASQPTQTQFAEQPSAMAKTPTAEKSAANKPVAKKLTERQKIARLLAAIESQPDAKFIRNGTAYTPTEAADHLRLKLENARKRVRTARDFIEKVASRSSVSGKDYLIELPDGRVLTTGQFLS
ncbi:MAG: DUF5329 family protein [Aureliella sp.]